MGELEELEEKVKELRRKREPKAKPWEDIIKWFVLLVCAPWLLVVVKNYGRDGWLFDHWDKWRLHWIPLTYVLYFGFGFLLFPTMEFVLYIGFPVMLAVGIIGWIPMSVPILWVVLFLVGYILVVFFVHKNVEKMRCKKRVLKDREKVERGNLNV